jgi:hypothetical protein
VQALTGANGGSVLAVTASDAAPDGRSNISAKEYRPLASWSTVQQLIRGGLDGFRNRVSLWNDEQQSITSMSASGSISGLNSNFASGRNGAEYS